MDLTRKAKYSDGLKHAVGELVDMAIAMEHLGMKTSRLNRIIDEIEASQEGYDKLISDDITENFNAANESFGKTLSTLLAGATDKRKIGEDK